MPKINVTLEDARQKARELYFGRFETPDKAPGRHQADDLVSDLLMDALVSGGTASRSARIHTADARNLWDPRTDATFADQINKLDEFEDKDPTETALVDAGILQMTDQYTAERMRNLKTEVLSRYVVGLIAPQTNIVNNFFRTIRADAGETIGQIREFVTFVETYSDWEYYQIDPNRGDIRSIEANFTQYSDRINPQMSMYGVKVEYENYLHRVLQNTSIAEVMAMLSVGWAKASAMAREFDASNFLTNYLAPEVAFDNNAAGRSRWGQLSGVGINGTQNGTFDTDYDFPRLLDYMEHELQMSTNNLVMLLPRNAWAFMNTRKGYKRFLGTDGQPLYQRPSMEAGPKEALAGPDRYGIRAQGVGYKSSGQAAKYLTGTREHNAARAGESMVPGPMPFLPEQVPNWMNTFMLPNSAFGPMRVVLTPFAQAQHRFYAAGHPLRDDPRTNKPRPIMTTDVLFFDGNHPMYLIETIPPTSWTATNDEYRKSVVVMVEAYAMANSARGQQACQVKGAVLDHNFTHDLWLNAADVEVTSTPLDGGLATS
jgi:hypothetical protein